MQEKKTRKRKSLKELLESSVRVEWIHIIKGKQEDPYYCPISLAIRDHFGYKSETDEVVIEEDIFVAPDYGAWRTFSHTNETDAFIKAFDAGIAVKPFSFSLNCIRKTTANDSRYQ